MIRPLGAAVALVCCLPFAADQPRVTAQTADGSIMSRLRPEQRAFVIVAERNGAPHTVAYTADLVVSHQAAKPRAVAQATPAPRATSKPTASPAPRRPALLQRTAMPASIALVTSTPIARASAEAPARGPDLVAPPQIAYVPTSAVEKPLVDATPTPEHDVAWLYAHRFDTPGPDELQIPGVPVRSQVSSPFDIRSGAFHGVRTINGFSSVRATVSIPCGARHFMIGPGYNEVTRSPGMVDLETGYVYIGGWGAGPRGVAVDAGLQKSSAQAARDEYAFYWKYASNKPITSSMRFPCGGPDVTLELYPVSATLLVFSATGVNEAGNRVTLTMVQKTRPDDGWIPSGGSASDGIIIKRIVAIAQPGEWRSGPMMNSRFQSGSYFGVSGPSQTRPLIVWRNCEVGRVVPPAIVPRYQPWSDALTWTSPASGIYLDWPPLGIMRQPQGVCDAVGILLRGG